jgi:lipoic acid synthetase
MIGRLPQWLVKKNRDNNKLHTVKRILRENGLNTVCESARCPNIAECFSKPTATFMILGNVCTRGCGFCSVDKGYPMPPVDDEPLKIAEVSAKLSLKHVVITSVTRDDLPDKGAGQFARTIDEVRKINKGVTIEVLTPDFSGSTESIMEVAERRPEIYNHNVETVPRLYKRVRPQADYKMSLNLFDVVKKKYPDIITKSGIMVGLGEERDEVISVMRDLRSVGCDVLTIGQYLMPTKKNLPVIEYIEPEVFDYYKREGEKMGFKSVESGPFVRSSYNARMLNI